MELLLIRHAKIAGNSYVKPARPVDGCLSSEGVEQAKQLGKTLAETPITMAFCSSYGRAIQTAEIALAGRDIPIQIIDALHEWLPAPDKKGLTSTEHEAIVEQEKNHHAEMTYKTDLGEGLFDMYARVIPPFQEVLFGQGICPRCGGFVPKPESRDKTLAFFAHGGSLNVILSHLLQTRPFPVSHFNFELTGIARICFYERAGVYYPSLILPSFYQEERELSDGVESQIKNEYERNCQSDGGVRGDGVLCFERQRRS